MRIQAMKLVRSIITSSQVQDHGPWQMQRRVFPHSLTRYNSTKPSIVVISIRPKLSLHLEVRNDASFKWLLRISMSGKRVSGPFSPVSNAVQQNDLLRQSAAVGTANRSSTQQLDVVNLNSLSGRRSETILEY